MKLSISILVVLILYFTSLYSYDCSRHRSKAKTKTILSNWTWTQKKGYLKDVSINSYGDYAGADGKKRLWGLNQMTGRWRRYPGNKVGITALAFSNENVLWICRNKVIERYEPFHSNKFKGRWIRVPGCCNDIDIGANNLVVAIGCDNYRYGFGIWRNLGGDFSKWKRIPGQADTVGVGGRGQIAVSNRVKDIFYTYNKRTPWTKTEGKAIDVSVTDDGNMVVIGTDNHVYYSTVPGPKPKWSKDQAKGYRISARQWRHPVVVGMDHSLWHAK